MREPITAAQRRTVQRAFEQQGYVIVAYVKWAQKLPTVGSIVPRFSIGPDFRIVRGPMIVTATATYEEWCVQREKYVTDGTPTPKLDHCVFFKLVAE